MEPTIVVVAEDVTARIIAETLLKTQGFRVDAPVSEADTRRAIHKPGLSVLVVDVGAPCPDGSNFLAGLRRHLDSLPPTAQPRVLVVLNGDPEAERAAHRLGADVVLHRPLSPAQFLTSVEHLLQMPRRPAAVAA